MLKPYQGWALITGASSGLGREFARRIAAQGIDCFLVGLDADALEAVRTELIEKHGIQCRALELDLTVADAAAQVRSFTGDTPVGILVNNAGIAHGGPFETRLPERLESLIRLNCLAPVLLTRAYLPAMIERGSGAIITVASIQAFITFPHGAAYNASKAFLLHFGESLWGELRGTPIDSITVCPAGMRTPFFEADGMSKKDCRRMWLISAPPEKIAALALRRLGKGPLALPGQTRLISLLARILPRRWVTLITARVVRQVIDLSTL